MTEQEYALRLGYFVTLEPHELLDELLTIIHGDYQYISEHGLSVAVLDAEVKCTSLNNLWDALESAIESMDDPTSDSVSGS